MVKNKDSTITDNSVRFILMKAHERDARAILCFRREAEGPPLRRAGEVVLNFQKALLYKRLINSYKTYPSTTTVCFLTVLFTLNCSKITIATNATTVMSDKILTSDAMDAKSPP